MAMLNSFLYVYQRVGKEFMELQEHGFEGLTAGGSFDMKSAWIHSGAKINVIDLLIYTVS